MKRGTTQVIGYTKKDLTKTELKVLELFGLPKTMYLELLDNGYSRFTYALTEDTDADMMIFSKGKNKGKVELSIWGMPNYVTTPKQALKDLKKIQKVIAEREKSITDYKKKLTKIAQGKKKAD